MSGQNGRKKVLFFIPSMVGGGAERFFSTIVRHLDRSRFEPHLALLEATGEYLADIPSDVTLHALGVSRMRYALPRFVRLVRKLRPDTILSTLGHANVMLTLAKPFLPSGTRILIQQDVLASACLSEDAKHARIWLWLYRRFYPKADRVLCLSQSMVSDMTEHFGLPREKLVSIYYPVDSERVRLLAGEGGDPFSGPGPHLLAAGRLTRQKGFDILLQAMPAVLLQIPSARLTILGQGPLQNELTEQARKLGIADKVQFPGFQQNPWRYIKHATIFVMPSRYEGLGNILLEALVLGTPVVASDCPGAMRELQEIGVSMTLVPPENVEALANAIVSLCRNPQKSKAELVENKFGLARILEEYARIL
jgi:glycosyltransferase involved in cell wall biosynthesis